MISLEQFRSPPSDCAYLKGRSARMEYVYALTASSTEYGEFLVAGWRHFGRAFFHPVCPDCQECRSIRIPVATFKPNRSQRRAAKANRDVTLEIGEPTVTSEKLFLYDRFHEHHVESVGWDSHEPCKPLEYQRTYVESPIPIEEWCYYSRGQLIGVGYVDAVPNALSAIYYFYEPEERDRSLGIFNVLKIIETAANRGMEYVYLGYYVQGCRSLEYKATFCPNEILGSDGRWGVPRT